MGVTEEDDLVIQARSCGPEIRTSDDSKTHVVRSCLHRLPTKGREMGCVGVV